VDVRVDHGLGQQHVVDDFPEPVNAGMRQGLVAAELDAPEQGPGVGGCCRDGGSGRVGLASYRSHPGAEGHMTGGVIGAEGAQDDIDSRFALAVVHVARREHDRVGVTVPGDERPDEQVTAAAMITSPFFGGLR
jgi:hypothetical protein